MTDVELRIEHDRLLNFASYAAGCLEAVNASHRLHREHPHMRALLRRDEVRRGHDDIRAWLLDLARRAEEDRSARPAAAVSAARLAYRDPSRET